VLLAPGVSEGAELYQIACSSCHGVYGEGMFGLRLLNSGVKESKIRSNMHPLIKTTNKVPPIYGSIKEIYRFSTVYGVTDQGLEP